MVVLRSVLFPYPNKDLVQRHQTSYSAENTYRKNKALVLEPDFHLAVFNTVHSLREMEDEKQWTEAAATLET